MRGTDKCGKMEASVIGSKASKNTRQYKEVSLGKEDRVSLPDHGSRIWASNRIHSYHKYLQVLSDVHQLLCLVVEDIKMIKAGFLPSFLSRTLDKC